MNVSSEIGTNFYQGKKITVLVGARPGVAYDLYARLVASHMKKYIHGKPEVVVENVAGAGSKIIANGIYGARPDGLTLAAISPELYFAQLLQQEEVYFDWSAFSWIGTPDRSNHLLPAAAPRALRPLPIICRDCSRRYSARSST